MTLILIDCPNVLQLDLEKAMMDCLYAKCRLCYSILYTTYLYTSLLRICLMTCLIFLAVGTPCITDCVMAELEKLGQKYRVALRHVL